MCERRNKAKHAHMLGKPFGDILDYWISLFAVGSLISADERNRMLTWITSKYDATKASDSFSRIYFVRKVLLANATRKGWINPYDDNIENNISKASIDFQKHPQENPSEKISTYNPDPTFDFTRQNRGDR